MQGMGEQQGDDHPSVAGDPGDRRHSPPTLVPSCSPPSRHSLSAMLCMHARLDRVYVSTTRTCKPCFSRGPGRRSATLTTSNGLAASLLPRSSGDDWAGRGGRGPPGSGSFERVALVVVVASILVSVYQRTVGIILLRST